MYGRGAGIQISCPSQAGLAVVRAWLGHIGKTWCGSPADISACLYHTQQAVSYLLQVGHSPSLFFPLKPRDFGANWVMPAHACATPSGQLPATCSSREASMSLQMSTGPAFRHVSFRVQGTVCRPSAICSRPP